MTERFVAAQTMRVNGEEVKLENRHVDSRFVEYPLMLGKAWWVEKDEEQPHICRMAITIDTNDQSILASGCQGCGKDVKITERRFLEFPMEVG